MIKLIYLLLPLFFTGCSVAPIVEIHIDKSNVELKQEVGR